MHIAPMRPYFGLRSYQDDGETYDGQLGSEATPAEFVDALIAATREMVRCLKPSGSIWINLGDKYAGGGGGGEGSSDGLTGRASRPPRRDVGIATKSLMGIPWRYALRCIDDLGLILRAEVIWSKPNGLPESVTDRPRRSHEQWFFFTKEPRYFSAVDEVREGVGRQPRPVERRELSSTTKINGSDVRWAGGAEPGSNPLGKLPGSVWTIPTQPLTVPPELGVDHFAAFPMEFPRRIIRGWSPSGVCVACGEGRRPVSAAHYDNEGRTTNGPQSLDRRFESIGFNARAVRTTTITGYVCACPDTTAPTRPSVILDPFGGTGTTALVAHVLGRHGISVDMSGDYSRLAAWRTTDPGQVAAAMQVEKPAAVSPAQDSLFDLDQAVP